MPGRATHQLYVSGVRLDLGRVAVWRLRGDVAVRVRHWKDLRGLTEPVTVVVAPCASHRPDPGAFSDPGQLRPGCWVGTTGTRSGRGRLGRRQQLVTATPEHAAAVLATLAAGRTHPTVSNWALPLLGALPRAASRPEVPEVLAALAASPNPLVRQAAAAHPDTSDTLLLTLAHDPAVSVRAAALRHPSCPVTVVHRAVASVRSRSGRVITAAVAREVDRISGSGVRLGVATETELEDVDTLASALAHSPALTAEHVTSLATGAPSLHALTELLDHPQATAATVRAAADGPWAAVAVLEILSSPLAPADVLERYGLDGVAGAEQLLMRRSVMSPADLVLGHPSCTPGLARAIVAAGRTTFASAAARADLLEVVLDALDERRDSELATVRAGDSERYGAAIRPDCPPAVLARLFGHGSQDRMLRTAVLEHDACPAELLVDAAHSTDPADRLAAARHPATPAEVLTELAVGDENCALAMAADNPACPPAVLDAAVARGHGRLALSSGTCPSRLARALLAAAPMTATPYRLDDDELAREELAKLAAPVRQDMMLRAALGLPVPSTTDLASEVKCSPDGLPAAALERVGMLGRPDRFVLAVDYLRTPTADGEVLRDLLLGPADGPLGLAPDDRLVLAAAAAAHPQFPTGALAELARAYAERNLPLRRALADRPQTPTAVVDALVHDRSPQVRTAALAHPNVSTSALAGALTQDDVAIARTAGQALAARPVEERAAATLAALARALPPSQASQLARLL